LSVKQARKSVVVQFQSNKGVAIENLLLPPGSSGLSSNSSPSVST